MSPENSQTQILELKKTTTLSKQTPQYKLKSTPSSNISVLMKVKTPETCVEEK